MDMFCITYNTYVSSICTTICKAKACKIKDAIYHGNKENVIKTF